MGNQSTRNLLKEMGYKHLAISLLSYCNANCDFCLLGSENSKYKFYSIDKVKNIIKEAKELGFLSIGFTGGEVTLYPHLPEVIEYVISLGMKTSIITNGSWGCSYIGGFNLMKNLNEKGLTSLTISSDKGHSMFIDSVSIINALNICNELGMKVVVQSVFFNNDDFNWLKDILVNIPNVNIQFIHGMRIGNAILNKNEKDYIRSYSNKGKKCYTGGSIYISVDGEVSPCCSVIVSDTLFKNLGNVNEKPLSEIIVAIKNNIYLYYLRNNSFDKLVDIYEKSKGISLQKVSDGCELCQLLFKDVESALEFAPICLNKSREIINGGKENGKHIND